MKWSTYFVTVIPHDQPDDRLQARDEPDQVSMRDLHRFKQLSPMSNGQIVL